MREDMPVPMNEPWDSERAREAAKLSHEARRRKKELTPEQRALEAIQGKLDKLVRELMDAALGEGDFEQLKPEVRVSALKTAIEYGMGRPSATRVPPGAEDEDRAPTPEGIFKT